MFASYLKKKTRKNIINEFNFKLSNEKYRRDAAKIISYVASSPNNDFAQRYKTLWTTFLEQYVCLLLLIDLLFFSKLNFKTKKKKKKKNSFRFKNGTSEIQLSCMKHLKNFFYQSSRIKIRS